MAQTQTSGGSDDLELAEHIAFQQKEWVVQRIGWGVMLLLVIAAAAGMLGSGPISRTSSSDPEGLLSVEYQRFGRLETTGQLRVGVRGGAGGEAEVWISNRYLRRMEIERIMPEPRGTRLEPDRQVFVFEIAGSGQGEIVFHLRPMAVGRAGGQVGLAGGPALELSQFVYP